MYRDAYWGAVVLFSTAGALSASYLYAQGPVTDAEFEELAARFIDEMPEHSPVSATQLGDHRFDAQLDRVDSATRAARKELFERYLSEVTALDRDELSRANQVDAELLRHELEAGLWSLAELQSWAWNPLDYTDLAGSAIPIVSQHLCHDRHTSGAVPFHGQLFVRKPLYVTCPPIDGPLNRVFGHRVLFRALDGQPKAWIAICITTPHPCCDNDLFG